MKICPKCGKEVDDEVRFCNSCGYSFQIEPVDASVENEAETIAEVESNGAEETATLFKEPEMKSGSKNAVLILIGSVLVLAAIIAAVILFVPRFMTNSTNDLISRKMRSFITTSGAASYEKPDHTVLNIEGEFIGCVAPPSGNCYVVLTEDGDLLRYDKDGKNEVKIAEDVYNIEGSRDKGFVYSVTGETDATIDDVFNGMYEYFEGEVDMDEIWDVFEEYYPDGTLEDALDFYEYIVEESYGAVSNKVYCRYLYETGEAVELGGGSYVVAYNSLNMLYTDNEAIYQLNESDTALNKMASIKGTAANLVSISNDGNMAIWTETVEDYAKVVYAVEKGEMIKLGDMEIFAGYDDTTYADFFNSDTEVLIYNICSKDVFRKKIGSECVKVSLSGGTDYYGGYSINNYLTDDKGTIGEIYLLSETTENGYEYNLYVIGEDGSKEKLLSEIGGVWLIRSGKIFYSDDNDDLYVADISKSEVTNKVKIGSDISWVDAGSDSNYMYFVDNYDSEAYTYSLNFCDLTQKDISAETIADGVYRYYISAEGKEVAYISDVVEAEDYYATYYGDLYLKKVNAKADLISEEVIAIYYNYSTYMNAYIDSNELCFLKYKKVKKELIQADYSMYNGKETKVIVKNVEY